MNLRHVKSGKFSNLMVKYKIPYVHCSRAIRKMGTTKDQLPMKTVGLQSKTGIQKASTTEVLAMVNAS